MPHPAAAPLEARARKADASWLRRMWHAWTESRRRKAERAILKCLRSKPGLNEFELELMRRMLGQ